MHPVKKSQIQQLQRQLHNKNLHVCPQKLCESRERGENWERSCFITAWKLFVFAKQEGRICLELEANEEIWLQGCLWAPLFQSARLKPDALSPRKVIQVFMSLWQTGAISEHNPARLGLWETNTTALKTTGIKEEIFCFLLWNQFRGLRNTCLFF